MSLEFDEMMLVANGIHRGGGSVVDSVSILVLRETPSVVYTKKIAVKVEVEG
jgi:hypothetical protein